ncbi:MAG: hypothetical protein U5M23_04300 [Marinagarivorans sp.]|nr:hypothetical protein [Marinagarivorans sp.]
MTDKNWCKLASQWLMAITFCVLAGCTGDTPQSSASNSSNSTSSSSDATAKPFITT